MVRGTANQYDAPSRYVAYRLGSVVVAVDYRLAPGGQARQKATEHLGLSQVFKRRRATPGSRALLG